MKAIVLDFEATDATGDAQAAEIGIMGVDFYDGILDRSDDQKDVTSKRCKPDRPISFDAMAVTGIFNEDVASCESHIDVCQRLMPKGAAYIIGHNIDFDIQVAANAGVDVSQYKRICTLALARRMLPDLDSHSLGALTYAINPELARRYCRNAHNAGYDVTFTLWLLEHLCELGGITSMEQLYEFSEFARIPTHFPFGKHKGVAIAELATNHDGRGYLQWAVNSIKDNEYLTTACRKALGA